MDLMALEEEPSPSAGQELVVRVLGQLGETSKVVPTTVEPLHRTYFRDGQVRGGSAGPSCWVKDQARVVLSWPPWIKRLNPCVSLQLRWSLLQPRCHQAHGAIRVQPGADSLGIGAW